jgi:Fe2+ or Zn2+ uptake regulation protein
MRINHNREEIKAMPVTPQRKLLLGIMREAGKHLDAKEVYRRASERDPNISLATVYRNLRVFEKQGLINEACGQVVEFESSLIRKLVAEVQRKNNFSVTKVELYLEGHCHKCKEEKR